MDILVIGGMGFIGVNFVQRLLDKYTDYNVVCIDKLSNEINRKNLEEFQENKRFYFYHANQIDLLKLFKFWFGFDIIVNFVDEQSEKEVQQLLTIVKKYKTKKLLQISSSKSISFDIVSLSHFFNDKIPVLVLKHSNNYGSFQHPTEFIPTLITNALEGNKLIVPDPNTKDWINVLDFCRGIETLMHYGNAGKVYELGGGNKIHNIDIALFIADYLKVPKDAIELSEPDEKIQTMYFESLNKQYGWNPIIDLSAGLADTIEWYKENETWWKSLKQSVY